MAKRSSESDAAQRALAEDCVQRLVAEFPAPIPRDLIRAVVADCQHDLAGQTPASALPELVERLARHRLLAAMNRHEGLEYWHRTFKGI